MRGGCDCGRARRADPHRRRRSRPAADQPEPRRRASATGSPEDAAVAALRAFLKDTFPTLAAPIRYVTAIPDPDAEPPLWRAVDFIGAGQEELAEAVVRIQAADPIALDDPGMREAVAAALHERRLSVNQRTARPFVFRGGGLLGTRARAWTIHDAVKHMDRRPEDGIYHLTNGTLAQWLDEEGAADLAALARHAVDAGRADRRKALEIFLIGTGLVARPRLKTRPKALDLGYAISGETVAGRIRLGRGRGRGYLYGELEPGAPWLEVQPRSFAGGSVDLAVTADTHTLRIDPEPYDAAIVVHTNAAAEPIGLPVRLRMVGNPAPVNRFLHRPFAGLALGVLLGALVGWLWAQVAPALPPQLTDALRVSPTLAWTLLVAALWGVIGLVRGALQPPAWPILYVTKRWLIQLAIWGAILALAGYGLAVWWQRNFGPPGDAVGQLRVQAALIGVILADDPGGHRRAAPAARRDRRNSRPSASFATAPEAAAERRVLLAARARPRPRLGCGGRRRADPRPGLCAPAGPHGVGGGASAGGGRGDPGLGRDAVDQAEHRDRRRGEPLLPAPLRPPRADRADAGCDAHAEGAAHAPGHAGADRGRRLKTCRRFAEKRWRKGEISWYTGTEVNGTEAAE